MTRKDYINIAAAILATQERIKGDFERKRVDHRTNGGTSQHIIDVQEQNQLRGVRRTAAHIADFLKDDNPHHFDVQMFLTNCGYGVGPFVTRAADSEEAAEGPKPWSETMGDPVAEMARKLDASS